MDGAAGRERAPTSRTTTEEERAVRCARCGHELTRESEAIEIDGAHAHSFSNPSGVRFDVVLFADASGATEHGEPTTEATWFAHTAWVYADCARCRSQVGWRYTFIDQKRDRQRFAALISDCIVRG